MYGSLTLDRTRTGSAWSHASNKEAPKEQSERFQADLGLNLTNSSTMERDRKIPLCCGGFANLPAIRTPFTINLIKEKKRKEKKRKEKKINKIK